jgi:predicted transcriptional regulator
MKWRSIKVANPLVERIERIASALGIPSTSQFIGEAIARYLRFREREYDQIELERETGRKVLGKED